MRICVLTNGIYNLNNICHQLVVAVVFVLVVTVVPVTPVVAPVDPLTPELGPHQVDGLVCPEVVVVVPDDPGTHVDRVPVPVVVVVDDVGGVHVLVEGGFGAVELEPDVDPNQFGRGGCGCGWGLGWVEDPLGHDQV